MSVWKLDATIDELDDRAHQAIPWGAVTADPEQILELIEDSRTLSRVEEFATRLADVPEHRDMAARILAVVRGEVAA